MIFFRKKKEYGLVFAGGGTKGAYQVEVAKALKEMNIKVKAVTGTSIGAINAALFIQNDMELMENLYETIEINDIMKISEKNQINQNEDLFSVQNIMKLASEYLMSDGISNEPLKKMLEKYLNIDKIYKSKIDLGIVTYDMSSYKGIQLFKNDIPKENLYDYLLASSCFPIFKPQVIHQNEYLDGGLSDNMPINMLIKKGYKNIILIDVTGIGVIKKNVDSSIYVKVIRPEEDLGGTFNFNHDNMIKNMKLGYYDTLKSFHKVIGNYFCFSLKEFNKLLKKFTLEEIKGLEIAGKIYGLDRFKIYEACEFLDLICMCYDKEEKEYQKVREQLTLSNISSYIKRGTGISVALDLIANYPTLYHESLIKKMIGDYVNAAHSIQIVKNLAK